MEWAKNEMSQKWNEPEMESVKMEWVEFGMSRIWNEKNLEWTRNGIGSGFNIEAAILSNDMKTMSDKFTYPKQKLSLKFSLNEAWHNKHGCAKIGKKTL